MAAPLCKLDGAVCGCIFTVIPIVFESEAIEYPMILIAYTCTTIKSSIARPRLVTNSDINAVHFILVTAAERPPLQILSSLIIVLFFALNLTL